MASTFDASSLPAQVHRSWETDVLPVLSEYTTIVCLSPAFAADWEATGALRDAAQLLASWCAARPIAGLTNEVLTQPGRTPVLLVEAPAVGSAQGTVLIYGHMDKQPPQGEWHEGLGPYQPVRRGDRLFGRGTADDGYSVFAALSGLEALGPDTPRPRVLVLIEASEESASPDLASYLDLLAPRLADVALVICLDSGCLTYDRLWLTSSLRGALAANVRVDVLSEGMHSGLAGGVIPSSFRILRQLLSRLEDEATGEILLPELHAVIPDFQQASLAAVVAEYPGVDDELPVVPGLRLLGADDQARMVAKTWQPSLAMTGMDGIPAIADAGNVLRPYTAARISVRLPPSVDPERAATAVAEALSHDPPDGAQVRVEVSEAAPGWVAPAPDDWVARALDDASMASFGQPAASYGEGGTIPFLSTLGVRFPGTQMVATGVLGPGSNAHGPNEFLHLPMAEAVTVAVAHLVAAAARR